jgi:hypothetical protein
VYPVIPVEQPTPGQWQHAVEVTPVFADGEWLQAWQLQYTPAPQSITPLQARKALRIAGLKVAVDAYIATLPEAEREEWEYANVVERTNATLAAGASHLGISETDMDNLFRLGETL